MCVCYIIIFFTCHSQLKLQVLQSINKRHLMKSGIPNVTLQMHRVALIIHQMQGVATPRNSAKRIDRDGYNNDSVRKAR